MARQHKGGTTIIDRIRLRHQRPDGTYDFADGGRSTSQGQPDIVWTLPFVFLMTVIFMSYS
jgi:hypothetical protein